MIEVANVGRRPLHLQTLPWFTVEGQEKPVYMVKGPWQPTDRLAEGESATMLCNQDTLDIELDRLESVVVRDVTNREWKGKVLRAK